MQASSGYRYFNGRKYYLWLREERKYALRFAKTLRDEGHRARITPDPRIPKGYEVWSTKRGKAR